MSKLVGPEVWDDRVAPGGYVCAECGVPTESQPCPDHSRPFTTEEDALHRLCDQAVNTAGTTAGIRAAHQDAGLIGLALARLRAFEHTAALAPPARPETEEASHG